MKKVVIIFYKTFICCLLISAKIDGAEDSLSSRIPFQLLFNPEYKKSIIVCGIKVEPCIDDEKHTEKSEEELLRFMEYGVNLAQKRIEENNHRVVIFPNHAARCSEYGNCTGQYSREALIYQKRYKDRKTKGAMITEWHYHGSLQFNENSLVIYNIPWHNGQKSCSEKTDNFYIPGSAPGASLILIDTDLLQRDEVLKKLYARYHNWGKKIIICDPYSGTVEQYCTPSNDYVLYPLLAGCCIGSLLYHYPELIHRYLNVLSYYPHILQYARILC